MRRWMSWLWVKTIHKTESQLFSFQKTKLSSLLQDYTSSKVENRLLKYYFQPVLVYLGHFFLYSYMFQLIVDTNPFHFLLIGYVTKYHLKSFVHGIVARCVAKNNGLAWNIPFFFRPHTYISLCSAPFIFSTVSIQIILLCVRLIPCFHYFCYARIILMFIFLQDFLAEWSWTIFFNN